MAAALVFPGPAAAGLSRDPAQPF